MDDAIDKFAAGLAAEIDEAVDSGETGDLSSGEIFTRLMLERLEDAGHLEGAFDLHQEGQFNNTAYRIDGYSFDEDRETLDLFTTIHTGEVPPPRVLTADMARAAERSLRFARAAMEGLADRLEPSNTDASDLARRIERDATKISRIRVIILSDAVMAGSMPVDTEWNGRSVEYEAYDIVRLQRVLGDGETRSDISVDLEALNGAPVPCLHVAAGTGDYDAYLTVIPGEILSKIYDRYGVRLLELNVRAFLGIQGRKSVNAELRRTIAEQPSMFLAFNNGIVATVDEIETDRDDNGRETIRRLRGLQIVNGGQTTASLHRARKKESISLASVEVPMKIIHVTGADLAEMVSSVSRAANRQNTVQLADFSANDPFHQEVETLANNAWLGDGRGRWFYERARGSYLAAEQKAALRKTEHQTFRAQTPKSRRIGKLDLARYLSAWDGLPYRVCLGGQKNFQYFMQRMKDGSPPPPDAAWFRRLIAIAIVYRAAEKAVRLMKFQAFRAPIVAYLMAGLAHRTGGRLDFEGVWSRQAISPELETLFRTWAPVVDTELRHTAGQRNPGEWFKKEDCWKAIKDALPPVDDPLPPELSRFATAAQDRAGGGAASPLLSAEDFARVSRCMEISSTRWLETAELGQQTGTIHWKVAGICRTLASYAAGGWVKKPSPSQARPALAALKAAEDAGILPSVEIEAEQVG